MLAFITIHHYQAYKNRAVKVQPPATLKEIRLISERFQRSTVTYLMPRRIRRRSVALRWRTGQPSRKDPSGGRSR